MSNGPAGPALPPGYQRPSPKEIKENAAQRAAAAAARVNNNNLRNDPASSASSSSSSISPSNHSTSSSAATNASNNPKCPREGMEDPIAVGQAIMREAGGDPTGGACPFMSILGAGSGGLLPEGTQFRPSNQWADVQREMDKMTAEAERKASLSRGETKHLKDATLREWFNVCFVGLKKWLPCK